MEIQVGLKIKFESEKQCYTVQASNNRFTVCTKPLNCMKTVCYTVIDFQQWIRGTENLIFGSRAENKEQCNEMLARLSREKEPTEISHRNWIELDIEKIYFNKKTS